MKAQEFVAAWKRDKDDLSLGMRIHMGQHSSQKKLRTLNVTVAQREQVIAIVDGVLTDVFYTLLLGLDGSGSIGGIQQTYKVYGEDGELISDCGDIEAEAAEAFS